jgi:DNA-binding NarL/FixJ family response regulator
MIRVLIADDHSIFRLGLRRVLEAAPDIVVVAEAGNGEEAMAEAHACDADVAVVDVSMPGRGGLETIRALKAAAPRVKVLILTVHAEERYAVQALRRGADGYLTKDAAPGVVAQAVRRLAAGGKYISPALGERLAADLGAHCSGREGETLSLLEEAILREIVASRSTRDIAAGLRLSIASVRGCRARVLQRMHLKTNADLIRYALRTGLER